MTLTSFSSALGASTSFQKPQITTKFSAQQNRLSQSSGDSVHFSGRVAKPEFDYNSERNNLYLSGRIDLSELSEENLALIENANYINIERAKISGETLKTNGSISISGDSRLDVDNVEAGGEFSLHKGTVNGNVKAGDDAYSFGTIKGNMEVAGTHAGVWGVVEGDIVLTSDKELVVLDLDAHSECFIPNIKGSIRFPNKSDEKRGVVVASKYVSEFSNFIEKGRLVEKAEWDVIRKNEAQALRELWGSKLKGLLS